jgi:hypothetical protein
MDRSIRFPSFRKPKLPNYPNQSKDHSSLSLNAGRGRTGERTQRRWKPKEAGVNQPKKRSSGEAGLEQTEDLDDTADSPMKDPMCGKGSMADLETIGARKKLDMDSVSGGGGAEVIPPPPPSYVPPKEKKKQKKSIEAALAREGKENKMMEGKQDQAASSSEDRQEQ